MATCCIQPLDMLKVRMQLQGQGTGKAGNRNPFTMFVNIVKKEGPFALYSGLSAGILRQVTYGTSRLGIFSALSKKAKNPDGTLPFYKKVVCSLIAGGTGALIGTPADAALVRMQADTVLPLEQRRGYKNAIDALLRMAREEGMAGFFSGVSPTVYRALSINVGMLSSYDSYKSMLSGYLGEGRASHFGAGFFSGLTAATVSLPFDFVKTRLQNQRPNAEGVMPYKSFVDCGMKCAAQEGIGSFYSGYFTYCIRITPHIMLTWVFLEYFRNVEALK